MPSGIYVRTKPPWNKGLIGCCSKETLEKMSKSMKGKNKGKILSLKSYEKLLKFNKGHVPWNKGLINCYSNETLKRNSESHKGKVSGMKNKHHTEETKEKCRVATIKYLSNSKYNHNNISEPEKIFYERLKKEFTNVVREHPIGGFCCVDDYLKNYNLVIEIYGNYPHANPKIFKAKDRIYKRSAKEVWQYDKQRVKKLKNLGYKVLIFWEDEIYGDIEGCMKKILGIINECLLIA